MKFKIIFLILMVKFLVINGEVPKPSYARTILKVARSLPGETEELKVRTSEGNLATLIVKRREKSENSENSKIIKSDLLENNNNTQKIDIKLKNNSEIIDEINKNQPTLFSLNPQKSSNNDKKVDYGSWTPLDNQGFNIIESTTETYLNWKPLPSDTPKKLKTEEIKNYGLLFARNFQDRNDRLLDNNEQKIIYKILPHSRPLTRTNIGANLSKNRGGKNVPPEVTVRSEINVKSLPKRQPMSIDADGTPVIHGKRVPDEPIDKIQTWRNSRVINNKLVSDGTSVNTESQNNYGDGNSGGFERQKFERFFKDINRSTHQQALTPELWLRRYGRNYEDESKNIYYEWDPKGHRNIQLNADVYETKNENYRSNIQKRMLHPESMQLYPNSQMYTPESQKISPLALKPGARAPVLQYAHPELGVQPAKILKSEKKRPDNFPDNQNSFTEQRHKKKYVLNDKNIIDSYTNKNYYPNQHFYGLKQPSEQPFWIKISENLKNQFSTGVERVSQFTKPVFDPLVEATQKISQNLGLSRGHEAQDKVGTVATGSSILIPALGLVASGAALGIGAVAVGRFLDVDVIKRSNENSNYEQYEKQRSIDDIIAELNENHSKSDETLIIPIDLKKIEKQRKKRSLDDLNLFDLQTDEIDETRTRRSRRTGGDSLIDIINVDVPEKNDIIFLVDDNILSSNNIENTRERERRSTETDIELDDIFQNLSNSEIQEITQINNHFTNTPCAKRIFCQTMIQRGADASILMEKKMDSLLRIIPEATAQVSSHFHEVMEAVRRHDCSRFQCSQSRSTSILY